MTMASSHTHAPSRSRRLPIRDTRLGSTDMRTRRGKRFAAILAAVRSEFGDVDPIRAAEIVRLRMISEAAQRDCLDGKVTLDRLVRISNLLVRAEKQLTAVAKAKPAASGAQTLNAYLAELAAQQGDEAEAEPEEVDAEVADVGGAP